MTRTPLCFQNISDLAEGIRKKDFSPVEITESYLSRIDAMDKKLGAFRMICREKALGAAKAAEIALQAGQDLGPLHGIPYAA